MSYASGTRCQDANDRGTAASLADPLVNQTLSRVQLHMDMVVQVAVVKHPVEPRYDVAGVVVVQ